MIHQFVQKSHLHFQQKSLIQLIKHIYTNTFHGAIIENLMLQVQHEEIINCPVAITACSAQILQWVCPFEKKCMARNN